MYLFFLSGNCLLEETSSAESLRSRMVIGMAQPDSRTGEHVVLAACETIVNLGIDKDVKEEKD
jgi:hypothetical protein